MKADLKQQMAVPLAKTGYAIVVRLGEDCLFHRT